MDNIRHILSTNVLGTDSGIDGCSASSLQPNISSSNSEPTSAAGIDLSDTHLQDDITLDEEITSDDDNNEKKTKIANRISTDSGSTFEMIEYNSPESSGEDGWCSTSGIGQHQPATITSTTLTSSVKIHENDSVEERDTYSPFGSISIDCNTEIIEQLQQHLNATTEDLATAVDGVISAASPNDENNKQFRRQQCCDRIRLSSKEEKQRQNEEIVIMESSSVSSETGSWESVFPQRVPLELKECCTKFLSNERQNSDPSTITTVPSTNIDLQPSPDFCPYVVTKVGSNQPVCFIDASSLFDDTEVTYSSLTGPKLPETACCGPAPKSLDIPTSSTIPTTTNLHQQTLDPTSSNRTPNNNFSKLETFHSEFKMCGSKTQLNDSTDSKNNSPNLTSPNLSDEQKLLHRDSEHRIDYDIKDQYSSDSSSDQKMFLSSMESSKDTDIGTTSLQLQDTESLTNFESKIRHQELERKKGTFLFKNSIQHYSGHVNSLKSVYSDKDVDGSDLSLPSNYSMTSESQYPSVFDNVSQYGDQQHTIPDYGGRCYSESESTFYPDTPHNSIVNAESPMPSPRHLDHQQELVSLPPANVITIPKRIQKHDESAPILSGGVSIKDFTPKLCESPSVRRRTEACPILSGGLVANDFVEDIPKPMKLVERQKNPSINTWVVDMSDCNSKSKRQHSESSSSSTDNTTATKSPIERSGSSSSHKSALGFYVSLNDIKSPKKLDEMRTHSKKMGTSLQEPVPQATGFFVNLSDSDNSVRPPTVSSTSDRQADVPAGGESNGGDDKKSIFSMFIDFGEKKNILTRDPSAYTSRLSSSLQKQKELDQDSASVSKSDSPIIRRCNNGVATSSSVVGNQGGNKRHSWNTSAKSSDKLASGREYARSASISTDKGIMSILDKIPFISKTSSMSIDSPNSPYDDFTCSKSLSSYSNNSNSLTSNSIHSSGDSKTNKDTPTGVGPQPPAIVCGDIMTASAIRRRQKDAKINETFDKSSQGSLTDGILSKDSSPTTDTDDVTFQNDIETIQNEPQQPQCQQLQHTIMETIVETKEMASPKKIPLKVATIAPPVTTSSTNKVETHTMESLQATIEKQKLLLETVNEEVQLSSFVKLSDMDKPVQKFELHSTTEQLSKSVGSSRIGRLFVETKKLDGGRNSWHTMSRSTGNNLTNLASSVENLRSLTRLFPHLSKELSNSLPADIQIDDLIKHSPNEYNDYVQTDLSCASSLTSSFSRSGIDSADESSLSCRQPRRLGEDLLKMFLQEIATDVIIEVGGRRMRAHKCILRSRCQYFAAILAGGWVQNAGNVITIPGYSYGSVHFALCHIYSGAAHPPDGISLMELSALADLLGLEGLKEVTAHALRTNYCHNFHKPCSGCIEGILQVFPITLNHGLDELYRKCLRWTCKYYGKVWPTRAFAQLPPDIIGRCKQHVVAHLTSETVLYTILDFDQLLSLLAPCRWATGVENTVRDVIDIGHTYISEHFANLLASDGFLSLGHGQSWNISRLENVLLRIASTLTPEQACKSYQRVTRLNTVLAARVIKMPSLSNNGSNNGGLHISEYGDDEEEMDWNPEFIRLVSALLSAVEQCLTRQCARAMRNSQWQRMDLELRTKIQKLACLSDPIDRHSKGSVNNKTTYHSPISNNRNQDLHQIKLAIQAHSKRAQDSNQYRATTHTQTAVSNNLTETTDKSVQANHEPRSMDRGMYKISKAASRAQVPDLIPTIKVKQLERPSYFAHRRSQSETLNTKTTKSNIITNTTTIINKPVSYEKNKLSDIKPRYLEPRTQRNGLAAKTQSTTTMKCKNISSSESSRNSSPAPTKRQLPSHRSNRSTTTINEASINMSRDSLVSSPAKQQKQQNKFLTTTATASATTNRTKLPNDIQLSIDSLCNDDSLRISTKTDKTSSQESLIRLNFKNAKDINGTLVAGITTKATTLKSTFSRSNPMIHKQMNHHETIANNKLAPNYNKTNKYRTSLSCQTTTENSPASVTTKSSRLSSITSAVSSPRDSYRGRSISNHQNNVSSTNVTTAAQIPSVTATTTITVGGVKKSFLSAKSKEILAAKKQTINQSESTKSVPNSIKEKFGIIPVNKSSSTSNILRRSIPFQTTLHLRRTAKLNPDNVPSNTLKKSSTTSLVNGNKTRTTTLKTNCAQKPISTTKIKIELEKPPPAMRIESKLERSSTFCKESSDIPTSEFQIIE